jgi:N-acetylmuramic acid 6-phosphate etherase
MGVESISTEDMPAEFAGLDTWDDARIVAALAEGQARAIEAARAALLEIVRAARLIADRLRKGGRLIYAGAGASIRMGVQDGTELPGTFGFPAERIGYLIAGGRAAVFETLADAEDDAAAGARDAAMCEAQDAVIAIAASGSTPYTLAAAATAKARGALVIGLCNSRNRPLGAIADVEIVLESGPEIIAGSTRMGAGTAQKAALNIMSTLVFIRLGAVHDGLMVDVDAGNAKLRRRAAAIVMRITGADASRAGEALEQSAGKIKPAVLLCSGAGSLAEADMLLEAAEGNLRLALSRLSGR